MARFVKTVLKKALKHCCEDVLTGLESADIDLQVSEGDGWQPEEVYIHGPLGIKPGLLRSQIDFETPGAIDVADGSSIESLRVKLPRWVRQVLIECMWPKESAVSADSASSSGAWDEVHPARPPSPERGMLRRVAPPEPLTLPTQSASSLSGFISQSLGASLLSYTPIAGATQRSLSPAGGVLEEESSLTPPSEEEPVLIEIRGLELCLRTFTEDERLDLRADCAEQLLLAWLKTAMSLTGGEGGNAPPSNSSSSSSKDAAGEEKQDRAGFSSRLATRLDAVIKKIRANVKVAALSPMCHLKNMTTGTVIDFQAAQADLLAFFRPTSTNLSEVWFGPGDFRPPDPVPGSTTLQVQVKDLSAGYASEDTEGASGQLEIEVPDFGCIVVLPPEGRPPDWPAERPCPGAALRFTAPQGGTISLLGGSRGLYGLFDMLNQVVETVVACDAVTITSNPMPEMTPSTVNSFKDFPALWWRHSKGKEQFAFLGKHTVASASSGPCCVGSRGLHCYADTKSLANADALSAEEEVELRLMLAKLPLPSMLLLLSQSDAFADPADARTHNLLRQLICRDVYAMWPVATTQIAVELGDCIRLNFRDEHLIDLDSLGAGPAKTHEIVLTELAIYCCQVPFPQCYSRRVRIACGGISMSECQGRRHRKLLECTTGDSEEDGGLRVTQGVRSFQALVAAPLLSIETSSGCFSPEGKGGMLPWSLLDFEVNIPDTTMQVAALAEELLARDKVMELPASAGGMAHLISMLGIRVWSCLQRSCRTFQPPVTVPPRLLFVQLDIHYSLSVQVWPSCIPSLRDLGQVFQDPRVDVHTVYKFTDVLFPLVLAGASLRVQTTQINFSMEDSAASGLQLLFQCKEGLKVVLRPAGRLEEAYTMCPSFCLSCSFRGLSADCTTSSGEVRTMGRCNDQVAIECESDMSEQVRNSLLVVKVPDPKFRIDISPQLLAVMSYLQLEMHMQAPYIYAEPACDGEEDEETEEPSQAADILGGTISRRSAVFTSMPTGLSLCQEQSGVLSVELPATPRDEVTRHHWRICLDVDFLTVNVCDGISPLLRLGFANVSKVHIETLKRHGEKKLQELHACVRLLGVVGEFASDKEGIWEPFLEPWAMKLLVRYDLESGTVVSVTDDADLPVPLEDDDNSPPRVSAGGSVGEWGDADFRVREVDDKMWSAYCETHSERRPLLLNCATQLVKHAVYVSEEFKRLQEERTKTLRTTSVVSASDAPRSPVSRVSSSQSKQQDALLRPSDKLAATAVGAGAGENSRIAALNLSGTDIDAWFFRGSTLKVARRDASCEHSTERLPDCTLRGSLRPEGGVLEPLDKHVSVPASTALVLSIHEKQSPPSGRKSRVLKTSPGLDKRRHTFSSRQNSPLTSPASKRRENRLTSGRSVGPPTTSMSRALTAGFSRGTSPHQSSRRDRKLTTSYSSSGSYHAQRSGSQLQAQVRGKAVHFVRLKKEPEDDRHPMARYHTEQQAVDDIAGVGSRPVGLKFFSQKQTWSRNDDRPTIPLTPGWCVAMKDASQPSDLTQSELLAAQDNPNRGGWQRDEMVVQMLMPHPSRRLLLIGSPVRIFNYTDIPLELAFELLSAAGEREVCQFHKSLCLASTGSAALLGDGQPIHTEHLILQTSLFGSEGLKQSSAQSQGTDMYQEEDDMEASATWSLPPASFCCVPVPPEFRQEADSDFGFRLSCSGSGLLQKQTISGKDFLESYGVSERFTSRRNSGGTMHGQFIWINHLAHEENWVWSECTVDGHTRYFRVKAVKETIDKPYLMEVLNIVVLPSFTVTNATPAPLRVQLSPDLHIPFPMQQKELLLPDDRELAPGEAVHVYEMSTQHALNMMLRIEGLSDARGTSRWSKAFRIDPTKAGVADMHSVEIPFGSDRADPLLQVTCKDFAAVVTCPFWMTNNSSLPVLACKGELPFPTVQGVTLMNSSPTDVKLQLDVLAIQVMEEGAVEMREGHRNTLMEIGALPSEEKQRERPRLGQSMSKDAFDEEAGIPLPKMSSLRSPAHGDEYDTAGWGVNWSTRSPSKLMSKGSHAFREYVVPGRGEKVVEPILRVSMPCPVTSRAERGRFQLRHPEERTFDFAVQRDPLPPFFGDYAAPSTCFHIVPSVIITNHTEHQILVRQHSRQGKAVELEPERRIPHWTNKRDEHSLQISIRNPMSIASEVDSQALDMGTWSGDISYGPGRTGRYALAVVLDEVRPRWQVLTVEISDAIEGILSMSFSEQPCLIIGCWARTVEYVTCETDTPPRSGARSPVGKTPAFGKMRTSANGIAAALAGAVGQEAKAQLGEGLRRVENVMSVGASKVQKRVRVGFDAGTQAARRVGDAANIDSVRMIGAAKDMARSCKETVQRTGKGFVPVPPQLRRSTSPAGSDPGDLVGDGMDSEFPAHSYMFGGRATKWGWPLEVGWYQPFDSPPTLYISLKWKQEASDNALHKHGHGYRGASPTETAALSASQSVSMSGNLGMRPMLSRGASTLTFDRLSTDEYNTERSTSVVEASIEPLGFESNAVEAFRDARSTMTANSTTGRRGDRHRLTEVVSGEYDYDYVQTVKLAVNLGRTTPLVILRPSKSHEDLHRKKRMAIIVRIRPQAKADLEAHANDVRCGAYAQHASASEAAACAREWARLSEGSPDLIEITEVSLERLGDMEVEWVCGRCSALMKDTLPPETCARCQVQLHIPEEVFATRRPSQGSWIDAGDSAVLGPRGFQERKIEVSVDLSSVAVSVVSQGQRPQEFLFGELKGIGMKICQWRGQESANLRIQECRLDCQPRVMHQRLKEEVGGERWCCKCQGGSEDSAAQQLILETPAILASVGQPHDAGRAASIRNNASKRQNQSDGRRDHNDEDIDERPCVQVLWERPLVSVSGKVLLKRFKIFLDQRWELIFDHFAATTFIKLYQEAMKVLSQSSTDYSSRTNAAFMDCLDHARQQQTFIRTFQPPHAAPIVQVEEVIISGLEVAIWGSLMLSRLPSNAMPPSLAFLLKVLSFSDVLYVHGSTMVLEDWEKSEVRVTATEAFAAAERQYKGRVLLFLGRVFGSSNLLLLPKLLLNPFTMAQKATAAAADMIDVIPLAHLTMDPEYIQDRKDRREHQNVDSLQSGVRNAGGHLCWGLLAITDVFMKPAQQFRKEGVRGVPRGLCVGIFSCLVKPIDGLCQALRAMLQGLSAAMRGRIRGRNRKTLKRNNSSSNFSLPINGSSDGDMSPVAQPGPESVASSENNFGMQSLKCIDEPTQRGDKCLRVPRLLFGEGGAIVNFNQWHADLLMGLGPDLVSGICASWHLAGHSQDRVYLVLVATHSGMLLVDLNANHGRRPLLKPLRTTPGLNHQAALGSNELMPVPNMEVEGKSFFRRCCRRRARDLEGERRKHVEKVKVLGSWAWTDLKRVDILLPNKASSADELTEIDDDVEFSGPTPTLRSNSGERADILSPQARAECRASPRTTLTSMASTQKWLMHGASANQTFNSISAPPPPQTIMQLQSECELHEFQHVFCVEESSSPPRLVGWPLLGKKDEKSLWTACQDANRAITEFQPFSSSAAPSPGASAVTLT